MNRRMILVAALVMLTIVICLPIVETRSRIIMVGSPQDCRKRGGEVIGWVCVHEHGCYTICLIEMPTHADRIPVSEV